MATICDVKSRELTDRERLGLVIDSETREAVWRPVLCAWRGCDQVRAYEVKISGHKRLPTYRLLCGKHAERVSQQCGESR